MSTDNGMRGSAQRGDLPVQPSGPCDFEQVRQAELEEIKRRRSEAQLKEAAEPEKNLIGLALSGGGIRSAAFSLGVLHKLNRRGVLPFVDYLSTVSGGGYSGAFLSSWALGSQSNWANLKETRDSESAGEQRTAPRPLQFSSGSKQSTASRLESGVHRSAKFPERLLQFLHGGNYLRKTWDFLNRYLIGLLCIWLVAFSGLVAAASGTAYALRALEDIRIRSWLAALGFDGDVRLVFVPFFILLAVWLFMWMISYFRSLSRAEGRPALRVFCLLVLAALVATASLMQMSHIALNFGTDSTNKTATQIGNTLSTVIISAIGASLIPYLRPKALLRSGTNPQNTAEKYTFWIASRALLYGIPFVAVAYFAREDISEFNRRRDGTLNFSEIKDWENGYSPLFRQIREEYEEPEPPATKSSTIVGSIEPPATVKFTKDETVEPIKIRPGAYLWCLINGFDLLTLEAFDTDFRNLDRLYHEYYAWTLPNNDRNLHENKDHLLGDFDAMMSLPKRWWYGGQYALIRLGGEHGFDNPVWNMARTRDGIIDTKRTILHNLNRLLINPQFYRLFPATEKQFPDWRKQQVEKVLPLVEKAKALAISLKSSPLVERMGGGYGDKEEREQRELLTKEDRETAYIDINRRLLAAYYPDTIADKQEVFSSVVLDQDQQTRLDWFLKSLCVFLLAALIVDLNATSWHAFYSRQMANMWIEPVPGFDRDIPLARMSTVEYGWPYHLISGSLQLFGRRRTAKTLSDRQSFLFSRLFCGTAALKYAPTKDYMGGNYKLGDAVAVSAAAVSPVQSRNPLVTALLFIFNVRLGQWVANPSFTSRLPKRLAALLAQLPFTPLRFLFEMARNAEDRPHCFVTDGGHYENLGIEPLLKRRCKLIVASDAGQDGDYEFVDLMRVIRWARITEGIEFVPLNTWETTLSVECLIPDKVKNLSQKHFLMAKILYPADAKSPEREGFLVYLKSTLCKGDPCDLLGYRRIHTLFPHDETTDQFYDSDRFFCYWQLGSHIADQACKNLPENFQDLALATPIDDFIMEFLGLNWPGSSSGGAGPAGDEQGTREADPGGPPLNPMVGHAEERPEIDPRDLHLRQYLEELTSNDSHVRENACQAMVASLLDVFKYFDRNGLKGLTTPVREAVLDSFLGKLFQRRGPGVFGRRALERLTDDLIELSSVKADLPARHTAVEGLGTILSIARANRFGALADRIEETLAELCQFDASVDIRDVAEAGLKASERPTKSKEQRKSTRKPGNVPRQSQGPSSSESDPQSGLDAN